MLLRHVPLHKKDSEIKLCLLNLNFKIEVLTSESNILNLKDGNSLKLKINSTKLNL